MSPSSRWLAYLSPGNIRSHERWLKGGRQGSGRIVLEEINLRGITLAAPCLVAAKFVKCDLTDALIRFGDLTDAELIECIWDSALIERSTFNNASIKNCRFVGAALNIAKFIGAHVQEGDWSRTNLDRTDWMNAQAVNVCFQEANFQEARLDKTKFISCDLRGSNLAAMTPYDAVFEYCDFRNCDLKYLKLKNTVFYKCGFYGCTGAPTMEGQCEVIEPDLSEEFDGSKVIAAEKLFQLWGLG
jgi:uncharacterized protein YjbI with pentapeptide repeats